MRWRLDAQDIRFGEVVHEEPRYFRWHWRALLAAHWYVVIHEWGAAIVSERRVEALPPGPGGPYRALPGMTGVS